MPTQPTESLSSPDPVFDPNTKQAVSQVSATALVSLLLVLVVTCVLVLLALRRRTRPGRNARQTHPGTDAWTESARRVDLEDHPDIPREPGTE